MLGLSEWKHLKFNWPKILISNPVHSISLPHSYLFFQSGRAFFFLKSLLSLFLLSPIWASPRIAGVVFKLWFTDSDWNGEGEEERRGVAAFFQLSPSYSLLLESLQILLPLLILPLNDIYHRIALSGAMKQDRQSLARSISKFHFNGWGGYIWGFRWTSKTFNNTEKILRQNFKLWFGKLFIYLDEERGRTI